MFLNFICEPDFNKLFYKFYEFNMESNIFLIKMLPLEVTNNILQSNKLSKNESALILEKSYFCLE